MVKEDFIKKDNNNFFDKKNQEKSYSTNPLDNHLIEKKIIETLKNEKNLDGILKTLENIYDNTINKINNNVLSNLNIAYILHRFPTLTQTFVLNEIKWLKNNGFNVKVFCYNNPLKPIDLDFPLDVIRFDSSEDLFYNLENLLIENNIHLMHTHFVYPTATEFTFPIAEKLKIPFTVFAHAYDIFTKYSNEKNNIYEITHSNYCKAIFTLSNYHKNFLIEKGVPEEKIILTHQAVEFEINEIKPKEFNTPKKIVSISRFVEKKGYDVLIKTAELLQDEKYEFSIYGFGPLEKELKDMINERNLSNISIEGSLNGPEEVNKILQESDLLVAPCKIAESGDRDGFPTVILEGMAAGIPILTTSISAIPEIIFDEKNGFIVPPENPNELASKIKHIFSLPPEKIFEIKTNAQNDILKIGNVENTMKTITSTWLKG